MARPRSPAKKPAARAAADVWPSGAEPAANAPSPAAPRGRTAKVSRRGRGRAVVTRVFHVVGARLCEHAVRSVGPRNLFVEPAPCIERASAIRLSRSGLKRAIGARRKSLPGRFYLTEEAAVFAAMAARLAGS